jgi:hypothetical protein
MVSLALASRVNLRIDGAVFRSRFDSGLFQSGSAGDMFVIQGLAISGGIETAVALIWIETHS